MQIISMRMMTRLMNGMDQSFKMLLGLVLKNLRSIGTHFVLEELINHRKSSRPVYYSILGSFGQRLQYISITFPLHKYF